MSERKAASHFGMSRASVKKKMSFSVPPGYQRTAEIKRPKLDGFTGFIDQWLQDDLSLPRKQRHTAKNIFERLRDEHQFHVGTTALQLAWYYAATLAWGWGVRTKTWTTKEVVHVFLRRQTSSR